MKLSLTLIATCLSLYCFAQTGPGGVGTTDGTSALRSWYAASEEAYLNKRRVTTVNDLSGHLDTLDGGPGSFNKPQFLKGGVGVNDQSVFKFDGGDVLASRIAATSGEDMSFVVVFLKATGGNNGVLMQHGGRSTVALRADNTYYNDVGGVENLSGVTAPDSVWAIHTVTFNQEGTGGLNFFENGDLLATLDYTPEDIAGLTYLGGTGASTVNGFKGYIAEVMKFTKVLNSAERIIIDNYLSAKYDLPLYFNDVYKQDSVERGNFDFDVAGIGRVDADNLQADARGAGIVRMLNPSDLEDDEFLLWGHDGESELSDNYNDIPDGVDSRLGRVWRVSEVNRSGAPVNVGSLEVRWDLSAGEVLPAKKMRLLIDQNNNGTFTDDNPISGAVDLGDGIIAFNGVSQLADGRRFTLGIVQAEQIVLPVTLLKFGVEQGASADGSAHIHWETVREVDNDFFTVERSADAARWEEVQTLFAGGDQDGGARYAIIDHHPLPGTSYYRLRQTDTDGTIWYSSIAILRRGSPGATSIFVYPNPATGRVMVSGVAGFREKDLRLYDAYGREVTRYADFRQLGAAGYSFDVSSLPKGLYLLTTPGSVSRVIRP